MLDKVNFDSSNVVAATYNTNTEILDISFKGARVYRYFDISICFWEEFKVADSPGRFVNEYLNGMDCERIS